MDLGHKQTDDMLKKMEKRIKKVYTQAAKETNRKVKAYYSSYGKEYASKLKEYRSKKISKQEFLKWNRERIMVGKRWKEMRETIVTDLHNSNKLAASMVNGYLPDVYALNFNFGTYEVEVGSFINTSFTLYDRRTVERLIRDDPDLLPFLRINENKDLRWNRENFNNGILQGILQGEDIPTIARRVALGTSESDMKAAIRNARTATTGAENGGRLDSYLRAEEMGIKMLKMWEATKDGRTRDSHRELDGETQNVKDEFSNGLMFPGDPGGEPAEVYNCRCTMVSDFDGYANEYVKSMKDTRIGDMSYKEWKRGKDRK